MPRPEPMAEPQWHHRRASNLLKLQGQDRVGVDVRQHNEPFVNKSPGRLQRAHRVREKVSRVRLHLQLYPVGESH